MRITVEHTDNYIFTAAKDVIGQHISGVILFHETLYQKANNGTLFLELLKQRNIIPGIKVDKGVVLLFATNDESLTGNVKPAKSEGTDDGFNGEPAFCGKSIVHVANQMMSNKFNKPQSSVTLVEEEINLNKGSKFLLATLLGSPITTPDSSPPSTLRPVQKDSCHFAKWRCVLKITKHTPKKNLPFFFRKRKCFRSLRFNLSERKNRTDC
ncbi:fructose-bisphosphate aldolase 1-like [Polistes fuscatus]|uniref:fructose-bisphosphate aldolase 1-like n=1 Tax=Polistes fuscatus TaxID=30207 RepID=UPI001CA8AA1E|nr:fructose-bisphosphate aldolase 1-like [Polistes fuscatus]